MFTAVGNPGRIVSFKLSPGDDLEKGLIEVCKKYDIKGGVILSAFGSLQNAIIKNPVYNENVKYNVCYGPNVEYKGPVELIATSGVICHTENGEILPHIHVSLSYKNGEALGGHLCSGTKVAITVEGAIQEFNDIDMVKIMDVERNILVFRPVQL